jgi:hypothetical protein
MEIPLGQKKRSRAAQYLELRGFQDTQLSLHRCFDGSSRLFSRLLQQAEPVKAQKSFVALSARFFSFALGVSIRQLVDESGPGGFSASVRKCSKLSDLFLRKPLFLHCPGRHGRASQMLRRIVCCIRAVEPKRTRR